MLFCPSCSNLLLLQSGNSGSNTFQCQTCPYMYEISPENPLVSRTTLKRKELDDILGGSKAWENVDKTQILCPSCNHTEAYFFQLQTRSADEPMTTFYRCANKQCAKDWKVD
ncbi:hypothetical protein GQ42DRAFT_8946 [Ramicandelaber brevisporus]|nr:hypothetical protein GQ42DRAFT_8946 [Ramicandelaber brevisporus]